MALHCLRADSKIAGLKLCKIKQENYLQRMSWFRLKISVRPPEAIFRDTPLVTAP
jgi:hypothetical protein